MAPATPFLLPFGRLLLIISRGIKEKAGGKPAFLQGQDWMMPASRSEVSSSRWPREMVMTALGYAFVGNADVEKVYIEADIPISDNVPSTIGDSLNDLYCGSTFIEKVCVWSVFYQTEVKTEEHLKQIKAQVSEFCEFFSAWFLPLKDELAVSFGDKQAKPDLFGADDAKGIFLNYSTQLI